MNEPSFEYDAGARKGVITFPNGHVLRIGNVDKDKAEEFFKRHAKEFERRGCVLHASPCIEVRSDG